MAYYKKAVIGIALCFSLLLVAAPFMVRGQVPGGVPLIPFGGRIITITPCANGAIHVVLGPPRPGAYVWAVGTLTFLTGPPRHIGQALLGKAGPVYFCAAPGAILPGLLMIGVGSSL
ncbi:hypothetical protein COU17_02040 [Candidatus Kaiserbacteria bacterium CG10_big_fil_rev_8_21_14_0_10_49_17]|uniref:Uncharacterized protein n=1 Tax=Candidatus Kaiserbacteria bacterium CG10_big_fil_rev_8_21_14_0_10_49_17 TaxID=1974609 RepID=A0A2M6WEA5_9BACT|nr:MAG: hypothetical protein COU17_02040 [Candidatus Kaiserbacteria bacterium CG10_big_fil_rev_8_21_14_0_10_49_17]